MVNIAHITDSTKLKTFTYKDIESWGPCYSPSTYLPEDWEGTALDILDDKRIPFHDRVWVILRNDLVSEKLMRLFAVWCARQVQHLMKDKRSLKALDVAEKFAYGEATRGELDVARVAAWAAARAVSWDAAWGAAWGVVRDAAWVAAYVAGGAAWEAAWGVAWAAAHVAGDAAHVAGDAALVAQENKLREMLLAGIETGDVQVEEV